MKVVCDNCRAVYKVPDEKLVKAVNKATCRQCGHKMLIPRPKPNADPEERTLVTAVPPTPVGAPPRGGPPTHNIEERDEATLPGRPARPDDVPIFPGTPAPAPQRPMPGPASDFDGPSTLVSGRPPSTAPAYQSETALRRAPEHNQRQPPRPRATPPPAALRKQAGASSYSPPGGPQAGFDAFDPSGDLNWALLGTSMALFGAFLLAFLSVYNHALIMWFGLAMSFGGTVLTFLVLLTGGRGRRPARPLLSTMLGLIVAVVMATSMVGTKWGAERVIDAYDIDFAEGGAMVVEPEPARAGGTPPPAPVQMDPVPANEDGVADAEPEEPKPEPEPEPERRPEPDRRPEPEPTREPAPPPPPPAPVAPAAPANVPLKTVDIMIKSNLAVKKCFVPLFQQGRLPPRVDVAFTIQPSGRAVSVQVIQPEFRADLQGCLGSAIAGIQFPPTSGTGTKLTYPFVLKQ